MIGQRLRSIDLWVSSECLIRESRRRVYNEYPCLNHKSEFPIGITTTCDFFVCLVVFIEMGYSIVFRIISTIELSIKFTNLYEGERNPYLTR